MRSKRTREEVITRTDPAWPLVKKWIAEARNPVEVLSADCYLACRDLLLVVSQEVCLTLGAVGRRSGRGRLEGHRQGRYRMLSWQFSRL